VSDENKNIARRLMEEGWNMGQEQVVDQLMSPQCRFHDPVFPSLTSGAENYRQHIRTCKNAFPDLRFTIADEIAERNEVVLHWKGQGTHRGNFLGIPATNKSASVEGTSIHRIEEGKIVELWSDWNVLSLLEQLGVAAASLQSQTSQPSPGSQQAAGTKM
jgi:steroid delta-isomerase-like uncharacterized protein